MLVIHVELPVAVVSVRKGMAAAIEIVLDFFVVFA